MKTFHSFEEAERYADKNYFSGTYNIGETKNGNFIIIFLPKKLEGKFYGD